MDVHFPLAISLKNKTYPQLKCVAIAPHKLVARARRGRRAHADHLEKVLWVQRVVHHAAVTHEAVWLHVLERHAIDERDLEGKIIFEDETFVVLF